MTGNGPRAGSPLDVAGAWMSARSTVPSASFTGTSRVTVMPYRVDADAGTAVSSADNSRAASPAAADLTGGSWPMRPVCGPP